MYAKLQNMKLKLVQSSLLLFNFTHDTKLYYRKTIAVISVTYIHCVQWHYSNPRLGRCEQASLFRGLPLENSTIKIKTFNSKDLH